MAVKMQTENPDLLNTVFVESQGHTLDDVTKLSLEKGWFGSSAMWTTERPMVTGARGIPNFVLLSPEGEVVMMGNPMAMHGEIEEYLENFKRQRGRAPDSLPKDLRKAHKALSKGDYADALGRGTRAVHHKIDQTTTEIHP